MRISWGKGIVIAMSLFVIFIVSLSITLMTRQIDLDSDDYYKKEINYQEEIDQINNMNQLVSKPEVEIKNNMLLVKLPERIAFTNVELIIQRPDNNKLDQKFAIEGTRFFSFPLEKLVKGKYNYKLKCVANGKVCLKKGEIYF